ncbi:hypothetical protein BC332_23780 [Capsicum chinense]|nr:hypothetical protein BC332_23780 [Capsicum chinense]
MKKKQCVVQAQLCRCVMTLEVKGSSSSGIMISANGTSLSFTPMKFAIITGLNCVSNRYDFTFDEGVPNRMIEKYFNGKKIIQKRQLFLAFMEKVWGENNDEDVEKFAILYFLHSFVLSNIDTVVIPRLHFDLVVFKNIEPTEMEMAKLEIPKKDVTEDERSADSDDDFQDPSPKKINECSKKKQKVDSSTPAAKKPAGKKQVNIDDAHTQTRTPPHRAAKAAVMKTLVFKPIPTRQASSLKTKEGKKITRVIFPQVQSKADNHVEEVAASKCESHVEKEKFISKKVFDAFREEGCTDLHPDKTNIQIDSQHLIPDEILQSINLDYNLSEKIVHHDDRITDEKLDDTNLSDSQFTIPDELLPSLNAYQRESTTRHPLATSEEEQIDEHFNDKKSESVVQEDCQHIDVYFYYLRKKSKYDPNRSCKFSIVDCNFMNIISSLHDVYSADVENLMAGGHVAHINEYINGFRMHVVVPWHTVEGIYIPVNIKKKHHWVLAILSFSERCIFLYDSYESSGHYSAILDVIEKLAAIIPLCLDYCDFYVKKGIHVENLPRYKDKDSSNMFDVLFQENLPQQPSESLDCGVYTVTYAECLSYGHKILTIEFDPNTLRTRYATTLWDYGTRKQELNAHSDVEAPLRPPRQSRITSVTEVFDHIDVCFYYLRKKSKYEPHSSYKNEPNKSYKYSTVDCNFMNVIRSLNDVYYMDAQNLKDGERCIFLYDSYESSGHYAAVLADIEKIAKIIPLCLQACDFYVKKGIDHQSHPRYKDKESSDMFDVLFQDDLPQQPKCLSYGHKVIASEFDPNALRIRYAALLWDYGIRKQEVNAIIDVEAPVRPARQSRITSVTEVVDV